MAINANNILAGISAAGTSGAELVWFGQVGGYTAPTNATTALDTATASDVQTITVTGTPAGGTFTLTLNSATTSAIAYNAAASAVQTALEALSTVGTGNVVVTGGPGPGTAWIATFGGALSSQNVTLMTASGALLTGGSSPTVSVAHTTPGKTGLLSAGLITEDGASEDVKESSKDVRAFGLTTSVRKIVTSSDVTVKTAFLETNKVTAAVRSRLPLNSIVVTGGAFTTTEGGFRSIRYGMVTHAVDGLSAIRSHYPNVEVTDRDGIQIKNGEVVLRGVTLTAYPDSSGIAVYTYNLVNGLT
jgi:hypothetical protein